jgi:Outer membrane lipoprotein-sorting protein
LAEEYDAAFVADESLGRFKVHHLKLNAKPGIDVASPVVELWIDQNEKNVMKRQEFALSGKLLAKDV